MLSSSWFFRPTSAIKSQSGHSQAGANDCSRRDAMSGLRLSVAGLMILVGVIAPDCTMFTHIINLWNQSAALADCLLIDVMPLVIGAEIAILFALRPHASRSRQPRWDLSGNQRRL